MSGAGLTGDAVVGADRARRHVGAGRAPRASRSVGSRSSLVATAIRRPPPAAGRTAPGGRSAAGRARPDRGRARPPRRARSASASVTAAGQQHVATSARACWPSASRPAPPPGSDAPGRRVEARASRTRRPRPAARSSRVRRIARVDRPAAPHRVEVDERAVLVEDDEVDAVEPDGHTSARRPPRRRRPRRRRADRQGRSTPPAGTTTVTGLADVGQARGSAR